MNTNLFSVLELSKLMILNGFKPESTKVEIVDFELANTTCQYLPDFPIYDHGTFGGLLANKTPMVCGGPHLRDCYLFQQGKWQPTFALKHDRFHSAGLAFSPFQNTSHSFFVVGSKSYNPTKFAEVLTGTG